jgi:hypothetical protein
MQLAPAETSIVEKEARRRGIEAAVLLAVVEVESGGRIFARVGSRDEPLIRFEGHYFDRLIRPDLREQARSMGLSAPRAGAVKNPAAQAARWQMLARAEALDRKAAFASTSWGLGQVMGEHWAWLGYAGVDELVASARSGFAGQLSLMLAYIDKAGLVAALRERDWARFARGYNGPAFARHGYHTRIAAAYRRQVAMVQSTGSRPGDLRRGSTGEAVARLQGALAGAGHAVDIDGRFGVQTEAAVRQFQRNAGIAVDGIVGPVTEASLSRPAAGPVLGTIFAALSGLASAIFAMPRV